MENLKNIFLKHDKLYRYKYFCVSCGIGSDCLYEEKCKNIRCLKTIKQYYNHLFMIENDSRVVFMFKDINPFIEEYII